MSSVSDETKSDITIDSLVVVKKTEPGVVQKAMEGGKFEVLMHTKKTRKIKEKDMQMLFPGPVRSWELVELEAEKSATATLVKQVYEQLSEEGEAFSIEDLSTLLFNEFTHTSAWAAWRLVQEDVYFHGDAQELYAYPQERVKKLLADRRAETKALKDKESFLERLKKKELTEEDHDIRLQDVVELALGRTSSSPLMKELGLEQTPENAHKMLLEWGHWSETDNPWPSRCGLDMNELNLASPAVRKEQRKDFTGMKAFAIDKQDILDPDDAVSISEDGRVWVHVSDVSSCVAPDSELDLEARRRASSAYLPDRCVPMLPWDLTQRLAVGNGSPTVSVGFRIAEDGVVEDVEVVKSMVKAARVSYVDANKHIENEVEPFKSMYRLAMIFKTRREKAGAAGFQMPEADVMVDGNGQVEITELPYLKSNDLVMEFMLMAGEAVAKFALDNKIPFVYSSQPPPVSKTPPQKQRTVKKDIAAAAKALEDMKQDTKETMPLLEGPPKTLAEMFNMRKRFQRSSVKTAPDFHHGLGMSTYTQFTSPLRRYGDLVAHQQIRAFLDGHTLLSEEEIMQRLAAAEEATNRCKQAERFSRQHWTLVWLLRQQPPWEGEGTCVEVRQNRPGGPRIASVMVPEIGFFCNVKLKKDVKPDASMDLQLHGVRLYALRADVVQKIPPATLYGTQEAEEYKKMMKARKNVGTRLNEAIKRQG